MYLYLESFDSIAENGPIIHSYVYFRIKYPLHLLQSLSLIYAVMERCCEAKIKPTGLGFSTAMSTEEGSAT